MVFEQSFLPVREGGGADVGRLTIHDIAREAGVSITAVSFALNDRPGVSRATRERVLKIAHKSGWVPHPMAQALSRARAEAVGYVIARPRESYASERFFFDFLLGLESQLTAAGLSLVLQTCTTMEQELDIYRKWFGQRRVDGVVITDPVAQDPRAELLEQLKLPGVFVGEHVKGFPSLVTDESGLIATLASHLRRCGATSVTYVGGNQNLLHTVRRSEALACYGRDYQLEVRSVICANSTEAEGLSSTLSLLDSAGGLPAIIYDNEVLSVGGVRACQNLGVAIGQDVLLASCEDSPICRAISPNITAVSRDPSLYAVTAANLLEEYLTGKPARSCTCDVSQLIVRSSTSKSVDNPPGTPVLARATDFKTHPDASENLKTP